jgi:DNA-binding CsgD family transcriptional regulator
MILTEDEYLAHYGTPRKSGRYPWGSGGDNDQQTSTRNQDWLGYYHDMKAQGLSDTEIARGMCISTTQLRARRSIANAERTAALNAQIVRLRAAGNSNVEIGKRLGIGESTVRSMTKRYEEGKEDSIQATANMLKTQVGEKNLIDIGSGVENYLGVSATRLNTAVTVLREQGYQVHDVHLEQPGSPGQFTRFKVVCPPGMTRTEAFKRRFEIQPPWMSSDDYGSSYDGIQPPMVLSPNRVAIRYAEDGGKTADGVIYVRPGVSDVSLGNSMYAQVRVSVGPNHYLKGMAVYNDKLPPGVDVVFNTNKSDTGNKFDAMKKIESDDPLNPYGATIRDQVFVRDAEGKKQLTSTMNIVNAEGSWGDWSKEISTQMLSKQSPVLIRSQLNMTLEARQKEFQELSTLTNPTVKRKLLEAFGDETDSAAVHLDAAGFKRQSWHAILPLDTIPPTQVYAPNFRDGEEVVLIRYPHGGVFEIPELVVNNNHREGKRVLGAQPKDAIGIHHSVAEKLSGADFDGDTVLVIPNGGPKKIRTASTLKELQNFNPRDVYKPYDGMKTIDGGTYRADKGDVDYGDSLPKKQMKQTQMGVVSNLITDMTIRQAPMSDIARAVKHSMVVIDAEKHHLNWKQSAKDNNIAQLQEKYQQQFSPTGSRGASTLISRATAKDYVPERKPRRAAAGGSIDKETGRRVFEETGRLNRNGTPALTKTKKLAEVDDAHLLSSGTPQERLYAEHSNKLKSLANQARLEAVHTPNLKYSPSAKKHFSEEVQSLNDKLTIAKRNRPLERQALVIANAQIHARRQENPNMDEATQKKVRFQALREARIRTGASRVDIKITPEEWIAIQAGAISDSKLREILNKADLEIVRQHATPRTRRLMTTARIQRAEAMLADGYTQAEVADQLGVSLTTLKKGLSGETSE